MSTAVIPSVLPTFIGEQGHHLPPDCLKQAANFYMARLLVDSVRVDTYATTISTASTADNTPAAEADEGDGEAHLTLRPSRPAPAAETSLVQPPVEESLPTVETVAEVSSQTHCYLENCDWIIPNLYLGGMEAAQDCQSLAAQGIQSVVCCSRDLEYPDSKFVPGLEYLRVDVEDVGKEPIGLFFPEATEFIHKQLVQGRPVLVHCKAGVSRSASVLLAYLIEYCEYSLNDAFLLTIRLRPTITPNPGFMDQLIKYEKEMRGSSTASIDIRKYIAWFQASERCPEPNLTPA